MSEAVVDTPQEDLQYIPQAEGGGDFETERGIWEAEAIRELFDGAPEAFGPDVDENLLYDRLYNLRRVVHTLSHSADERKHMKEGKDLPLISTHAGMSEVLAQVSSLIMNNDELLKSGDIKACLSSVFRSMERAAESGDDINDERYIDDISIILAMNAEQAKINPNLEFSEYEKTSIYKVLTDQYLAQLVLENPEDPQGLLTPQIHELWHDPDFLHYMSGIDFDGIYRIDNKEKQDWEAGGQNNFSEFEHALREKIFLSLGFDKHQYEKIRRAWGSVKDVDLNGYIDPIVEHKRPDYIYSQYQAMIELAKEDFDAPKKLFEQFGIRHFGRYKPKDLLRQLEYEHIDGEDVEILITAADDWNTAYKDDHKTTERTLNFSNPIYYECSTIIELTRMMKRASRRYGPIDKLLVSGHGAPDHFRLGRQTEPNYGEVDTHIISRSRGARRLKERKILSEDCDILISSCSVGKPGGVAEAIAKATGLRTISPDDISYGLYYDSNDGDYNARYIDPSGKRFSKDAIIHTP